MDARHLFVGGTEFEDFARRYGRSPSNYSLPSFARKVKPDKTSVIGVVGFHGLLQAIPFDANYTATISVQAMEYIALPVLPHNCYLVMHNVSIHTDDHLAQKNITLVKLPPYSYDLNPIEMVFGLVKAYSLRHKDIDNKAVRILLAFNNISVVQIHNFHRRS